MSYSIEITCHFEREAKPLLKKYPSLRSELAAQGNIYLLSIYDKGERNTISDKEIREILDTEIE